MDQGYDLAARGDEELRHADRAMEDGERLLKVAQVALMANVSESTVRNDIKAGRLVSVARVIHVRRRIRVPLSAAIAYKRAHASA